ncbi:MAG TPA: Fe-S cluster assembly protein SufD [Beijerinckiaceae bacterium]|nr:Fe-S cluster assembly protein SufD [Beijerinckiaceae bacterium]
MSYAGEKTKAETMLAEQFAVALPGLPGNDPAMKQRRSAAFAHILRDGLPSKRNESWHYTDLRMKMPEAALPMLALLPSTIPTGKAPADPCAAATPVHFSFASGLTLEGRSVPEGLSFVSIRDGLVRNHPMVAHLGIAARDEASPIVALNSAFVTDGIILRVAKGVRIAEPIRMFAPFAMEMARAATSRIVVILEEGAELSLVMSQVGPNGIAYQSNVVCECQVADDAKLDIVRLNLAGDRAQVLVNTSASTGARSEFNFFAMSAGGAVSRHEIQLASTGENAKVRLNGVILAKAEQHTDFTLEVDHRAPGCESRELFRSVIDGDATGVFQGKIMVKREAQRTDGKMASNAILLSDGATMNNKPELEIFADDVQCAHGATCGALDEDLLFYLQSRGLPKAEAEALMIQAFCGEAIESISNEATRDVFNGLVARWLKARSCR